MDRLVIRPDIRSRLADSVETATGLSGGLLTVDVIGGEELSFSQNYACPGARDQRGGAGAAHVLVQQSRSAPARSAADWASS